MTQQNDATPLLRALEELGSPRILVIGDLILDRYTWGNAERISQEAPVIVLRADHRETRLGGASNVCAMLRGLDAQVACAGVVGEDEPGTTLLRILDEEAIEREMVMIDPQRPTTVKERFMGRAAARHPNQILRVDSETREPLDRRLEDELVRSLQASIARYDAVLISDYGKGFCTTRVLRATLEAGRIAGVPVLVDPMRTDNFGSYRGATVLKPNRVETESATGCRIQRPEDAFRAGMRLCEQLDLATAIITLDRDGMALVPRRGEPGLYATRPRAVYDITGAGDVVLALLGICWARGVAPEIAVQLGNIAGALEVERTGVSKVTRDEIRSELMSQMRPGTQKILTLDQLDAYGRQQRRVGRKVVFTNGCFDLLHVGHVTYLADAAAMGDVLVVGVNSDASVRSLKGPGRPVISESDRAAMLAALACVDAVVVFDDATPHRLLEALRPNVLVKGGTYAPHEVVGREVVEAYGGEIRVTSVVDGISTTRIVESLIHNAPEATIVPLATERPERWREAG
jgi:D-beta-D-heptose 7-phosphate kinase/D-beta-D-heptose 1-phosphate adenosyltransferase